MLRVQRKNKKVVLWIEKRKGKQLLMAAIANLKY